MKHQFAKKINVTVANRGKPLQTVGFSSDSSPEIVVPKFLWPFSYNVQKRRVAP